MDFEITIPKGQPERLLGLISRLRDAFPEEAKMLTQISCESTAGVQIILRPYIPEQTTSQRGYYWKWLRAFAAFCGLTPDEMHDEILCAAFGSEMIDTPFGTKRRAMRRSSESNRVEYSLLIDTLIRIAADLNFNIPPPERINDERTD